MSLSVEFSTLFTFRGGCVCGRTLVDEVMGPLLTKFLIVEASLLSSNGMECVLESDELTRIELDVVTGTDGLTNSRF